MVKKYSICITNSPITIYHPITYLSEDFESIESAESRFDELAKNLKNDYPRGFELWLGAYYGVFKWSTVKDVVNW